MPSRRAFVMTSLMTGFTLAVTHAEAEPIHTDSAGLTAGPVQIPSADGALPGYAAAPAGPGPFPTVLVIEEIFGVHEYIKDVCRRLAKLGYLAVAPELYARIGDLSKMTDPQQIFRDVILKAPDATMLADLDSTAAWAAAHHGDAKRLGVIGFCRGGRDTWLYAEHNPRLKAAVAFYGPVAGATSPIQPRTPLDLAAGLKCPLLGLYGGADDSIRIEDVNAAAAKAKAAGQTVQVEVFPGALTRIAPEGSLFTAAGLGGGSKDTWVMSADAEPITLQSRPRRPREIHLPNRRVTSRVAEVFYWMGRYLERANNLAYIIQVVETLELEELNATERKLYRPMWNRLLPHLDASGRRSIATPCDRYRLVLQPDEPGALTNVLRRALNNADAIQDALSPEAWTALSRVRTVFARHRFQPNPDDAVCGRVTRKLSEMTTHVIPQFFGLAESSMMSDDGWRFCLLGQQLERAIITANAPLACSKAFTGPADRPAQLGHHTEIELSAFLRLLGTRDAYRRVYQMRAEPLPVLRLLFQNPEAPRSVLHSLQNCAALLRETDPEGSAVATQRTLTVVDAFCERLRRTDWAVFFDQTVPAAEDFTPAAPASTTAPAPAPLLDGETLPAAAMTDHPAGAIRLPELQARQSLHPATTPGQALSSLLAELIRGTMNLHNVIADVFLNHQAHISTPVQPYLEGFPRGI